MFGLLINLVLSPLTNVVPLPSITTMPLALELLKKSYTAGKEKIYVNKNDLEKGDVIGVNRGLYDHYGIYVGNKKVIHYTSKNSDTSSDNVIMETSLKKFLRGSDNFFVLNFEYLNEDNRSNLLEAFNFDILPSHLNGLFSLVKLWEKNNYTLYDGEETVMRAKSRLGERNYSLMTNNCEHFVFWCKTGVSKSKQLDKFLKNIPRVPLLFH